jgi:hypothetical protein
MAFDLIPQVIAEVRPYTMVPDDGLETTIQLTLQAINEGVPGDLVECGTWLGGSSFAMLLAQRYAYGEIKRPVWMYDSFEGMGLPAEQDGNHARWWRERSLTVPVDPDGQNYCRAPLDAVLEAINHFDIGIETFVVPGWLEETLPKTKPEAIAVLRVDCDWYEPCKAVYRELGPLLSDNAAVIIDDYDAWEGARLATHEYLASNGLPWKIRSWPKAHGAWMINQKGPW